MRPAVLISLSLACLTILAPLATAQSVGWCGGGSSLEGTCVGVQASDSDILCRPDIQPYCELVFCIVYGPWPCRIF